jgi:hypothetical protein
MTAFSQSLQPGKLVSLRGRDWIVLPSEDRDLLVVKPLGGSDDEIAGIYPCRCHCKRLPGRCPL